MRKIDNAGQTLGEPTDTTGETSRISKAIKTEIINGTKRTMYLPTILLRRIRLRGMELAIIRRNVPFSLSPDMELKVNIRAANEIINITLKRKSAFPNRSDCGLSMPDSLTVRNKPDCEVNTLSGMKGSSPEAKILRTDGGLKPWASSPPVIGGGGVP